VPEFGVSDEALTQHPDRDAQFRHLYGEVTAHLAQW